MKIFFAGMIFGLLYLTFCPQVEARQYDVDYYKEREINGKKCTMFYSYKNNQENLTSVQCN